MKLLDLSLETLEGWLRETGMGIVVYGAGVIGKITVPALLQEMGLSGQLLFFVDADTRKQAQQIQVGENAARIERPERLLELRPPYLILISGSRNAGILQWLGQQDALAEAPVCVLPELLCKAVRQRQQTPPPVRRSDTPLIPKVIHYCWFGRNPMPEVLRRYMASWQLHCPGYQIQEWNEDNFDVGKYAYTRHAYAAGKWAFVSDLARLEILYQYGGIYLDTDVELLRNLDELLFQPGFCCVEKWGVVNTGGGCGAVAGHPAVAAMLECRANMPFHCSDPGFNLESSGYYESLPFLQGGFVPNNTFQVIHDMSLYPSAYFHPYDYFSGETILTNHTYGIHHFIGSWV